MDRWNGPWPRGHAPTQVEIELTNVCNASCVACPRDDLPRYGYMTADTLTQILGVYRGYRNDLSGVRPKFILAGGGEPLLHRNAVEFVQQIKQERFRVCLITNASRLHTVDLDGLVDSVDEILVSFWGIEPSEYERAMGLDFATSLRNVRLLKTRLDNRVHGEAPIAIQCLDNEHLTSRPGEIGEFWRREGISDIRGFGSWWNRGGQLATPSESEGCERPDRPDFSRALWCSDIYFSDTYTWRGDLTLCCCYFFHQKQVLLGNVSKLTLGQIQDRKDAVFRGLPPEPCRRCELPRRSRTEQLAGGLRSEVSELAWRFAWPESKPLAGVGRPLRRLPVVPASQQSET